jgi:hypothetical protein
MPQVGFAAAITGRNNVYTVIQCRNLDELFEFTSDRVGALADVESADLSPIHRQVKQAGTLVTGNRLEERPEVRAAASPCSSLQASS